MLIVKYRLYTKLLFGSGIAIRERTITTLMIGFALSPIIAKMISLSQLLSFETRPIAASFIYVLLMYFIVRVINKKYGGYPE
jgi:hypothetical protein